MEVLKNIVLSVVGIGIGMILMTSFGVVLKIVFVFALISVWAAIYFFFIIFSKEKKTVISSSNSSMSLRKSDDMQDARISRNAQQMQNNASAAFSGNSGVNPLDRRPMSVEKKVQYMQNKQPVSKLIMLNEEGVKMREWSLSSCTSLIIGKTTDKESVDIDLSDSSDPMMISKQHAVLNYTDKGWFIDDIDSKNGTRVKKASQNAIMDVKLVGAIEVDCGDIIYIANTMLQIQ